jgi:hypothetical protein
VAGSPGIEVEREDRRLERLGGQRERRVQLEVGEVRQPHERRQVLAQAERIAFDDI